MFTTNQVETAIDTILLNINTISNITPEGKFSSIYKHYVTYWNEFMGNIYTVHDYSLVVSESSIYILNSCDCTGTPYYYEFFDIMYDDECIRLYENDGDDPVLISYNYTEEVHFQKSTTELVLQFEYNEKIYKIVDYIKKNIELIY